MAAALYYSPFIPAFSYTGAPLPGAQLLFYYTGTTTKAPVFTDAAMTIPASNPLIAAESGRFDNVYLNTAITYRVRMLKSGGSQIGSDIDPYIPGTALKGDKGDTGAPGTATSSSGLVVLDNNLTAQTEFLYSPPASAVNSEGGTDNSDLRIQTTKNYVANFGDGTFGTDYTVGFGWNYTSAFNPLKAGLPSGGYRIESKFRYNRFGTYVTQMEFHVGAMTTADAVSPAEFRPWTIGAPHLKADWANLSSITSQIAYISWADGSLAGTEWMAWDARASGGGIRYITTVSTRFREEMNDFPVHQQKDSGGLFRNLPYLNANDRLQLSQPLENNVVFGDLATFDFANDAAAAAAGVPISGLYHTSGTVKVRRT